MSLRVQNKVIWRKAMKANRGSEIRRIDSFPLNFLRLTFSARAGQPVLAYTSILTDISGVI